MAIAALSDSKLFLKSLRIDGGGMLVALKKFLQEKDISYELTAPYSPNKTVRQKDCIGHS